MILEITKLISNSDTFILRSMIAISTRTGRKTSYNFERVREMMLKWNISAIENSALTANQ